MERIIFVTGVSGALGPHLLTELLNDRENARVFALLRHGDGSLRRAGELRTAIGRVQADGSSSPRHGDGRLQLLAGDIARDDLGLDSGTRDDLMRQVHVVIHAAADTRFAAPVDELRAINVEGTHRLLEFAARCARLQQLLFVSTACVAGTRTGLIAERLERQSNGFVNGYEQTKWEAEQVVAASDLPLRIGRLSTCLGGEQTGYVHRFGALHQTIRWLTRGLVPMFPAADGARVDLISTDVAARWLARAAACPPRGPEVCHVSAGDRAIAVQELVDAIVGYLRRTLPGWSSGQIAAPAIVDAETFALFERSVVQSGDVLFNRVLRATRTFLPALLHPKIYETACAEQVWGGALPSEDWRPTLERVIAFGCARDWRNRHASGEYAHV